EFQDIPIRSGETLHILVHATARDPAICDDPEFSILAKRRAHFGFGGGAHHCMGAAVARADIACALGALTERIKTLRPAGPADWLPDSGNTGPVRLPLHFGRA
ncbi:MAG: cytochrome P450, partial [Pseudomonadota bacterium]